LIYTEIGSETIPSKQDKTTPAGSVVPNGFGLAEGGEFEILMLKFTIMFNRIPNAQTYDSAPLLANPC
jgi:hypothetical protein